MSLFPYIVHGVNIVLGLWLVYRFNNNKYVVFFWATVLIDPVHFGVMYFLKLNSYSIIPFIAPVLIAALPKRPAKPVGLSLVSVLILLPYFNDAKFIPLTITVLTMVGIIFILFEDIVKEIKTNSIIPLFLLVLILEVTRGITVFYLYYENLQLLSNIFTQSVVLGGFFTLLMIYLGPDRGIKLSLNNNEALVTAEETKSKIIRHLKSH